MLNTIVSKPRKTILYGAALTAVVLVIALLAVSFATGSAQAQNPAPGGNSGGTNTDGGGSGDSETNLDTYPDPQPCGPGAGDADMKEPHEITTGHYALFDAYWRTIEEGKTVGNMDLPGVGFLHTNLCPPEVAQTTQPDPDEGGDNEEGDNEAAGTVVITRSARTGGMEVDEAIIHVLNTHLATTSASAADGYLSLAEYPAVGEVVDAGDRVWWLQLDDPDSTSTDEKSDLSVGFSTLLLDDEDWYREDDQGNPLKPLRYKFEVERHPTNPTDVPHFFAYEAPKAGNAKQDPVWNSAKAGEGEMEMSPGEFRALQWVFTKPGTYLLWVHLLGDVKRHDGAEQKEISVNDTETSEVYRYTFQVGDTLDETEPPIFGASRSVLENSPGGVKVGDPIPVYNAEAPVLYYELTGKGHSNFALASSKSSAPHAVQIVMAEGAFLDYETDSTTYELNLTVTDKVDHEDNEDLSVDDVLIVRINLEDQKPGLILEADRTSLKVKEEVNFVAWFEPTPERQGQTPAYLWGEGFHPENRDLWHILSPADAGPTWSVSQSSAISKTYEVAVEWTNDTASMLPSFVNSNKVTITWEN